MRIHLLAPALATLLSISAALADTVAVIRPGLSCASPEALAKLSRPNGSSLVDGPYATREAMQIATQGGCSHLRIGQTFTATSIRKNTTVVMADAGDGRGTHAFYLPNIDLKINRTGEEAASRPASEVPAPLPSTPVASAEMPAAGPSSPQTAVVASAGAVPEPVAGKASGAPLPRDFDLDGIRLGDSYDDVHAHLHPDYFIKHVPLTDPGIKLILVQKTGSSDWMGIQFDYDKVVAIEQERFFGHNDSSAPPPDKVEDDLIARFGPQRSEEAVRKAGYLFWSYGASGQLDMQDEDGPQCARIGEQNLELSARGAVDEPQVSDALIQTGGKAVCHTSARAIVAPDITTHLTASVRLELRDIGASYRYALARQGRQHDDPPSKPVSADELDERPINVLAAGTKAYSAGGVTLGEDVEELKARMANAYKRYDGKLNVPEEQYFTLVRLDKLDRLTIQSLNGKVVAITHDQRFPTEKQPLWTDILRLGVENFGSKDDDPQALERVEVAWAIGSNGQKLDWMACGTAEGMGLVPEGEDDASAGAPINKSPMFFKEGTAGCKLLFGIDPFRDETDRKLLAGLRTVLVNLGAIGAYNQQLADAEAARRSIREKAAADTQAAREKGAVQAGTGL